MSTITDWFKYQAESTNIQREKQVSVCTSFILNTGTEATTRVFLIALYVYLCINIFNIYLCIPDVYMLIVPCAKLNHKTEEEMVSFINK